MPRQFVAVALATAALLAGTVVAAGSTHAAAPSVIGTEDAPVGDGEGTDAAAIEAAQADAANREAAFIRGDLEAADTMGFMPSLYVGKWFMPRKEDDRRCIMQRESNANYRATNGTYHGAYQMSAALGVGATWMMQEEVKKEFGDEGLRIVRELRTLTPNRWNRYWQDRAFWTIWRNGAGARHWSGAGC